MPNLAPGSRTGDRRTLVAKSSTDPLRKVALHAIAAMAWLLSHGNLVLGGQIYWTAEGSLSINRANTDGTGRTTLIGNLGYQPRGIAVDPVGGNLYWTGWGVPGIHRANLNGTQSEAILPTFMSPHVAFDSVHSKLILESDSGDTSTSFYQCNLDGSNLQLMFTYNQGGTWDFAIDAMAGKIYWTTDKPGASPQQTITRANFNGTQIQTLESGRRYGYFALDLQGGKMYWETNDTANRLIQSANLDGSNLRTLLTQADFPGTDTFIPEAIGTDPVNHKLYFENSLLSSDPLYRANLDGSGLQLAFNADPGGVAEFAIVPEPRSLILFAVGGLGLTAASLRRMRRRRMEKA